MDIAIAYRDFERLCNYGINETSMVLATRYYELSYEYGKFAAIQMRELNSKSKNNIDDLELSKMAKAFHKVTKNYYFIAEVYHYGISFPKNKDLAKIFAQCASEYEKWCPYII
jgi:hypothetical protein